ncbi:MAG: PBP1A family penicillin-binding protein [Deltaproteobacteria bacterium]|nr:PBP1A family penicillin-binding protein [Deltaproteobacteria bacterium]
MTTIGNTIRFFRTVFYIILAMMSIAAVVCMGLFFITVRDLPRVPDPLSRIIETPPTEIYAATGERIMVIGGREYVSLNQVSTDFIKAILATEDHRFWEHHGVDKLRTLKALWVTLFLPGRVEGASTITQQLSKNLFFSFKRSYLRKFRELMVALQIESQYGKSDILEAYINQISMGVGANGIEQASRTFFGKPATELSLAESVLLAGLPKSPTGYNPYLHFDRAKERQKVVLSRMLAAGYITPAQAESAYEAELKLRQASNGRRPGGYFLDMVVRYLEESYGPEVVYHGGLKITTTLDPQMQSWATESLQEGLTKLDQMIGIDEDMTRPQGALVTVEVNSGAVKAIVGGRNYDETEYNRAIQNNRLPGSGFKPFLYYTAFENLDLSPATVFYDTPVTIPVTGAPDWTPKNFEMTYGGPMILKKAFMESINTVAAQIMEQTGPQAVIKTARRCGIESPLAPVYSLALGTSGASPLEMASAFATFADGGIRHQPFWIWRVEDALGRILEEHIIEGERTLDANIAYQVLDLMRGVMDEGTGTVIRHMGFGLPAAGKTGTSDGYHDAWFTGFTPTLSTSVWVGFDQGKGLRDKQGRGITGSRGAAPIWADFMTKVTQDDPPREFTVPPDVRTELVDPMTGRKATEATIDPITVILRKGQTVESSIIGYGTTTDSEAEEYGWGY